jgi:hypothetical protein
MGGVIRFLRQTMIAFLLLLVVSFLIFLVVVEPQGFARALGYLFGVISDAVHGLIRFMQELARQILSYTNGNGYGHG